MGRIIVLCFVLVHGFIISQTTLIGNVKNQNNDGIAFANVILKRENSPDILAYAYADESGKYRLETSEIGNLVLQFSSLSFKTLRIPIIVTSENKVIQTDAVLTNEIEELDEVILENERPITIKKDTIIFDAKAFLQGNEQTVEDLLKKIPGLNISADGTIKVGNQEIEKIMIEGDDFFERGYKILTQNMPVNPIEKVEIFQKYSNNKHLKGVEKSEKVALNLTLKEDFKRQWFGNMNLGYGIASENRYEVNSNLMNFGKKNKFYFLTNLNNTGFDLISSSNQLIRPFRVNEPGSIGDIQSSKNILGLGGYTPNFKQERVLFNNAEMLSLNSIFKLSEKLKLKALALINTDEINFYSSSFNRVAVGETFFENNEDYAGKNSVKSGFGKIDLTYDISKAETFELTSKYSNTKNDNRSNIQFNNEFLSEKLASRNELIDQKAVYTYKLQASKALVLSARYIDEKSPQDYAVNRFIYQDLFDENANNLSQLSENIMQFAGFESHFLNRTAKGNLLEFKVGNQYRKDILLTKIILRENETILSEPIDYQNNLDYQTNDLYASVKFDLKVKQFSFSTNLHAHQLLNTLETRENKKSQNPFFINPQLGVNWEINDKNKIGTTFSFNTSNANVLDVYDNYVQNGFRSFVKGTGTFNQLESSNIGLDYMLGNWGDKFFATTSISYVKNHDFFSTNSLLAQNFTQTERIVVHDREYLSLFSSIDKYFNIISSNLKINFGASKSNYKNIVNNSDFRTIKTNSFDYGFEMRSAFKGVFNYNLGSTANYFEVKATNTNSFTNHISFLDMVFIFSEKINFEIQSERYYFGNLEKQNNTYYFLDFEARYVFKPNKLSFSLSANNLFNNKTFRNYAVSDISISKLEYRLQPRYLLLNISYRF
uniref:carboxypeptidase-like regulatory domain-containing protein n=1 Tax=Flavobacterium sp. TaxID=239 RepID=UPI00404917D1